MDKFTLYYLLLFVAGFVEEFIAIIYYKLVQKHYKFLCAIVSMVRTFIWAFILVGIVQNLNSIVLLVFIYALGGAIGDYTSLTVEPYIEKTILKMQRKGRRKKWWFSLVERK